MATPSFTADARLIERFPSFTADARLVKRLPAVSRYEHRADSSMAYLVDCEIVRKRKAELQSSSPADLARILGPSALDETRASVSLRQLHSSNRGRKPVEIEHRRFFTIGRAMDFYIPRFERDFAVLRELKKNYRDRDMLETELRHHFSPNQLAVLLAAKTPKSAAKRFVAQRMNLALNTVNSCYSRFVRTSKSDDRSGSHL